MKAQTEGQPGRMAGERTIGQFVSRVSLPAFYGAKLHTLVRTFKPEHILEFGTGSGISTLYMALAAPGCVVTSIDAHPQATLLANELCFDTRIKNVHVVTATFSNYLEEIKTKTFGRLLIFLDGDHSYEATLNYFNIFLHLNFQSIVIVIDDIDWSPGMMDAWHTLRRMHPGCRFTAWFRLGIVECKYKKVN